MCLAEDSVAGERNYLTGTSAGNFTLPSDIMSQPIANC
jgi:hypothetical protein